MANFDSAFDKMIRNEGGPLESTVMKREDGKMKIDGYDALDSACKKRWCWSPGNYQHRGACGSGGSRNTGMTTRCCLERAYRGCPDPVPEPGEPAPWDEVTPNA